MTQAKNRPPALPNNPPFVELIRSRTTSSEGMPLSLSLEWTLDLRVSMSSMAATDLSPTSFSQFLASLAASSRVESNTNSPQNNNCRTDIESHTYICGLAISGHQIDENRYFIEKVFDYEGMIEPAAHARCVAMHSHVKRVNLVAFFGGIVPFVPNLENTWETSTI
jgi:hypothetical protein